MKEPLTAAGYQSGLELIQKVESEIRMLELRNDISDIKRERVIKSYRSFLEKVKAGVIEYEARQSDERVKLFSHS